MTNEQLAALQAEINETQRDPNAGQEHQEQPAKATRTRRTRVATPNPHPVKATTPVTKRGVAAKAGTKAPAKGTPKTTGVKAVTVQTGPKGHSRPVKVVPDANPSDAANPQDTVKGPSRKAEAKRALARIVVNGIAAALADIDGLAGADEETGASLDATLVRDELGTGEEMLRIASQWIHHLPTGQVNGKRYWPEGLLRPDRSDWR